MDSFPSNSRRPPRETHDEIREVKRITTGEVVRRKPSLGRRMSQSLIGGDVQSVSGYVFGEILGPAFRDMIADAVTGGVERMIFGENSGRGSRRSSRGGGYTSYNRISSAPRRERDRDDRRDISRRGRATHSFDEIVIETRGEAEEVLRSLDAMVERYDGASVAHLYELVGISSNFTDQKWGWTSLRDARIQRVRDGYLLDLPQTGAHRLGVGMPSSIEERKALLQAYPPVRANAKSAWVDKVNKMSEGQVHAIYMRLKKQGVIK